MEKCVFCQIVNKNTPAYIIYQNKDVTAFLDINPAAKGHVLVCPNNHIEKLNEIQHPSISNALMKFLINVSNLLIQSGLCNDFSIVQANGDSASQHIKHLHFHIIPRQKNDKIHFKLDTDKIAALNDNLDKVYEHLLSFKCSSKDQ
ncbi:HIT family protein [Oceanobacillus sp. FSL W7-1281]|uniref:HIT family protein n=1 Tax=Oceanobacillus sp. FSL W7-1281 TaxID=2921698 RepID=UPI0030D838A2